MRKNWLIDCVRMVKIKFADSAQEADGFLALSTRMHVFCFPGNTYEFAESGLSVLNDLRIPFQVIVEEGFDRAYHELRNSRTGKSASRRSNSC